MSPRRFALANHSATGRIFCATKPSGQHGGAYWEIFAAVCPNLIEAIFAPIALSVDREKRLATIQIPGIGESIVDLTEKYRESFADLPVGGIGMVCGRCLFVEANLTGDTRPQSSLPYK